MAQLTYTISGDVTGLAAAANGATGILNNLQAQADKLNIKLFGAETEADIQAIGGALTIVTGQINEYTTAAIQGSQAFKDQSAQAALDTLATKITVLTGNVQLFGDSIKNQQAQLAAYQQALNGILAQGFDPLDSRVTSVKANIDSLTASIEAQKNAAKTYVDPFAKFQTTGSLIRDAENKVKNLSTALRDATSTRDIASYNTRLTEANKNLETLRNTGVQAAQASNTLGTTLVTAGETGASAISKVGKGLGSAFGLIRQAAYILPGIGIAGIFNVGFQAIAKATDGLNLFGSAFDANKTKVVSAAQTILDSLQKQQQAITTFNTSLSATSRVNAAASDGYAQEIVKLDLLFNSIKRNTNARFENGSAIQEIQKLYPDIFGSLTNEEFLTKKAALAYDSLRDSIIQTATVQAGIKLAGQALEENVKDTIALNGANDKIAAAAKTYNTLLAKRDALQKQVNVTGGDPDGTITNQISAINVQLNSQYDSLKELVKVQNDFKNTATGSYNNVQLYLKAAGQAQDKLNKSQPAKSGLLYDLENQLKSLQAVRPTIKIRAELDLNTQQIKDVQAKIDALGGVKGTKKGATSGISQQQFSDQLNNLALSSGASANQSGLVGLDLQLQQIKDKYAKYYATLQSLDDKRDASSKISGSKRSKDEADSATLDKNLRLNEAKEISDATITSENKTQQELQRIRDEFGIKSTQTREKEIASINTLADSEIIKAQGNVQKLNTIEEGRIAATQAVNDKYLKIQNDLYEQIGLIDAQAQAEIAGREETQTQKIISEWEKRRIAANKYFDQIKQSSQSNIVIDPNDPFTGLANANNNLILAKKQSNVNNDITKAENADIAKQASKDFTSAISQSLSSATRDIYGYLSTLNTQADQSLTAIFTTLTQKLTSSLNDIFLNVLTKQLSKALSDSIAKGTSGLFTSTGQLTGLGAGIAGAGIVGGIISGSTPKTSSGGQALGGALSGAAAGAAIGSVVPVIGTAIGAVGGALIGLTAGLIGASKARKAEAAAALAQQQQQTALLRASIAYTSSIIGRMTTQGLVTNVDLNAFGQLTAKVSGKDLQFVLDRNGR